MTKPRAWYNAFGSNGRAGLFFQRLVSNNTSGAITQSPVATNNCELPNTAVYDPANPVPTLGGNHSVGPYNPGLWEFVKWGPMDQRPIEQRPDVPTEEPRLEVGKELLHGEERVRFFGGEPQPGELVARTRARFAEAVAVGERLADVEVDAARPHPAFRALLGGRSDHRRLRLHLLEIFADRGDLRDAMAVVEFQCRHRPGESRKQQRNDRQEKPPEDGKHPRHRVKSRAGGKAHDHIELRVITRDTQRQPGARRLATDHHDRFVAVRTRAPRHFEDAVAGLEPRFFRETA